mgnify:CR=1 FL=1
MLCPSILKKQQQKKKERNERRNEQNEKRRRRKNENENDEKKKKRRRKKEEESFSKRPANFIWLYKEYDCTIQWNIIINMKYIILECTIDLLNI